MRNIKHMRLLALHPKETHRKSYQRFYVKHLVGRYIRVLDVDLLGCRVFSREANVSKEPQQNTLHIDLVVIFLRN